MRAASSDSSNRETATSLTPFVGRERELAELRAALDRMLAGHGQVVLLAGEPGIGKTRTAEEFVAQAAERGVVVLWGSCFEWEGTPAYWPWVQIFRGYLRDVDDASLRADLGAGAADVAQIVPELRERLPDVATPPQLEPEQARFRLFDAVTTFYRTVAARRPLVLVLDDLHWADTPSLLLLQFLTQSIRDARVLVLGGYRNVEVGRQHPLARTLGELARRPDTHRLLLHGLGAADIGDYVSLATGQAAAVELVETIRRETDGNPFFVSEVVRLLEAEGWPEQQDEGRGRHARVPESVREVVGRRLSRLSDACNRALSVAAVVGRDFRLPLLEAVADLPATELVDALDEAAGARLIEEGAGVGEYRFCHALIRETLYQELPTLRRLRLHGQIAETMERQLGARIDARLAELAYHYFCTAQAGYADKAIDYAVRAAEQALAQLGWEEAKAHYERALEVVEFQQQPDQRRHCEILLALGHAQVMAVDVPDSVATYRQAAAIARQLGDVELLARAALTSDAYALVPESVGETGRALLEEVLTRLPADDSALRVKVLSRLAVAMYPDAARSDEREELTHEAVAMARRVGDPGTLCYALAARWNAGLGPEHLEERIATATEIARVATAGGDRIMVNYGNGWLPGDLLEAGHIEEARKASAAWLKAAIELRSPGDMAIAYVQPASYAFIGGDLDEVDRLLSQRIVTELFDSRFVLPLLVSTRIEQGRGAELEQDVLELAGRVTQFFYPRVLPAYFYAALGRNDDARTWFEPVAENRFAALHRDERHRLFCLALMGETSVLLDDTARAADVYELLLPFADRCITRNALMHCLGSAEYYLGRLAAALGRMEQAEQHFSRSLEANTRLGAYLFVAYTQHAWAGMLHARDAPGDRAQALMLVDQALATARELGLVRLERLATPLQASASATLARAGRQKEQREITPFGLSQRELEILRLIVDGRADREIAGALFISRRTVTTHVTSILNKLGASTRTEAAATAVRHGLA
jgi:DNA-binding CsgD family transcriptional regulator